MVFMLAAGVNFSLHFLAWRSRGLRNYIADPEFRAYVNGLIGIAVVVVFYLYFAGVYDNVSDTVWNGLFQVISIGTTTGYTTTPFALWPGALPVLLILMSFVGGCAGSTGGGMKVIPMPKSQSNSATWWCHHG